MQYILSQKEYNEYMEYKRIASRKRALSKRQKTIFDYYKNNPSSTYKEASSIIWISDVAIFNHIVKMEKEWYLQKDKGWKIFII